MRYGYKGRSRAELKTSYQITTAIGDDAFEAAHLLLGGHPAYEVFDTHPNLDLEKLSYALDMLEGATHICPECHCPCEPKSCDSGIGGYEFWGQKCFDSRPYTGSDCCEADLEDDALDAGEW